MEVTGDTNSPATSEGVAPQTMREKLWRIVFLSNTPWGRAFDVILLLVILACTLVVVLESVDEYRQEYQAWFQILEWTFTIIFTLEFALRLWLVRSRQRYLFSFFGFVDLISILPSYLELLLIGSDESHYLITIRFLRLLRMFRILKMGEHIGEANTLINALRASQRKILVFLYTVMVLILVEGTLMYVLEHDNNPGFNNIPQSIYWAIVTLTTVGYGDVVPFTIAGKVMACIVMLTGFAIIAVPTGVVTAEINREMNSREWADKRRCTECGWHGHNNRAMYCHQCGTLLPPQTS